MRLEVGLGILSLSALVLVGFWAAKAPAATAGSETNSTYEELSALFSDWRAFERPATKVSIATEVSAPANRATQGSRS